MKIEDVLGRHLQRVIRGHWGLHEEAGQGPGVIPGESGNTGVVKRW